MAGLKPDQHRKPQEDSSASKGHEAAEPLPACSMPHASSAPPAKQLHAPGSSALTQSEPLVSNKSRLRTSNSQDPAHLLSNSSLHLCI